KRMILTDPKTGHSQFNYMGAMQLVQNTRRGSGSKTPKDQQTKEITILDRFNNAAVVKIVASGWIDYLEEAKVNGEWKIINVLWELKPRPEPTPQTSLAPQKQRAAGSSLHEVSPIQNRSPAHSLCDAQRGPGSIKRFAILEERAESLRLRRPAYVASEFRRGRIHL